MSRWPFERWEPPKFIPPELMVAVIYDNQRFTPEGSTYSILDVVKVYHGLPIEDAKRDLIAPIIKFHDRRLTAERKAKKDTV